MAIDRAKPRLSRHTAKVAGVGILACWAAMSAAWAQSSAVERAIERELRRAEREATRGSTRERIDRAREDQRRSGSERKAQREAYRDAWCDTFYAWASDPSGIPPEVLAARTGGSQAGQRRPPEVTRIRIEAWMLQDDRARRLFDGKTFAELSDEDLREIGRRGSCSRSDAPRDARPIITTDIFSRASHPRFKTEVAEDLAVIHKAQADAKALAAEVGTLGAEADALSRFDALSAHAKKLEPLLGQEARDTLTAAFDTTAARVLVPGFEARARAAIASASGIDGLLTLAQLRRDAGERRVPRGTAASPLAPVISQLGAAMQTLAAQVAASERSRIAGLGSGVAGLEAGVAWQRDHDRRIAPVAAEFEGLRALQADFTQRRAQLLDATRGEAAAAIGRTTDSAGLEQAVKRYVGLPADGRHPAGSALLGQAAERQALFLRNGVLGRPSTTPPRPAAQGEPGADDLYDALYAFFSAANARAADAAERCNSGGARNDSFLAMQCLGMAGAAGVGAGGTIRAASVGMSRLRKLGCAPATGQAGWMCDYEIGYDTNLALPPSMAGLMRGGSQAKSRFLRTGSGWQVMAAEGER